MFFLLLVVLNTSFILPIYGESAADIEAQKNWLDEKIKELYKDKLNEKQKVESFVKQKGILDKEKENEDKKIKYYTERKEYLKRLVRDLDKEVKYAEKKYEKQKELFKVRLRVMYENSGTNSYLQALAESESLTDFFGRLEIMSRISRNDSRMIKDLEIAKQDLEFKKKQVEQDKLKAEGKLKDSATAIVNISRSKQTMEDQINLVNARIEEMEKEEEELLKKSEELESKIKGLQSNKQKYTGGAMKWPVPSSSSITSLFGSRLHPVLNSYITHTGIDIAANYDMPIIAAKDGTVIMAGWQGGYGNAVVIYHGSGISTLYGHSSKVLVNPGDVVKTGDIIAKIGSTGLSTGPHLHFEVRKDGIPKNPLEYLN